MLTTPCHTNKLSLFFLFCFTLLLTFLLSLSWVSAKEKPKPKPQDWQINGISAALDDGYDKVKGYALKQLIEYNLKDLKSLGNKSEYFALKADNLLKDEKVDATVRYGAAVALGNVGSAAANYVPDILNFLKDEKVDANVRYGAAVALGNVGSAAANYVPDILNLMAAEYLKDWNQEFPLKKFSAAVYQMRLEDKQALPADEFHQVAMSLSDEKYKMVVSRQWEGEKGEAKKEWYFRHDKIMDFFLVQNFLGETDAAEGLLVDRMGDPRFRGVYFLLATLLEIDAAKKLREELIQYAADTKDNTVSNTFVQLLRTR